MREGSQATHDKLVRLVLFIAIAMTSAWLQGEKLLFWVNHLIFVGQEKQGEPRVDIANFWFVCLVRSKKLHILNPTYSHGDGRFRTS
jgi:hypothetical protein